MEHQLVNRKNTETHTQKQSFFSRSRPSFFSGLPVQAKLTIGEPDDPYEREADAMADKVMGMPKSSANNNLFFKPTISPIQRKCDHCEEEEKKKLQRKIANTMIQRQHTPGSDISIPHLTLSDSFSIHSSPTPDYLAMQQPFINRNIFQLWDPGSALQVWQYNFNFFRRLGLSPDLSNSLTNFTAPRFIDSQLRADNPTWWEITDQELNTSSIMGSIPVLEFGPDFSLRAPSWFRTIFQHGGNAVQRKCRHCEAEGKKKLQPKGKNIADVNESTSLDNYVTNLNGKGQPLPHETRSFFESRFGYDFSSVKAHTNTAAAQSAQSINALAYTTGNHIVFNRGQYDPQSDRGKRLLAHELTHVVQQNTAKVQTKLIQRAVLSSPRLAGNPLFNDVLNNRAVIERGDRGSEVRRIQQLLVDLGFNLSAHGTDGIFGSETEDAVKAFQRSRTPPLSDDGRVGFSTMAAFDSAFPSFTMPANRSNPWTMSCVLDILCPWNKHLVQNVLPAFHIITFNSRTFPTETWDGSSWVAGTFNSGGFTSGSNMGFLNSTSCQDMAFTIYHEGWHAQQPSSLTGVVDTEKDAYINTEQWSISMGLPGQGNFTNTATGATESFRKIRAGETVVNEPAAERFVRQEYGGVSATPGERILHRVGATQVEVMRPDTTTYIRNAHVGESVRGPVSMPGQTTISPSLWTCP